MPKIERAFSHYFVKTNSEIHRTSNGKKNTSAIYSGQQLSKYLVVYAQYNQEVNKIIIQHLPWMSFWVTLNALLKMSGSSRSGQRSPNCL